MTERLGRSHSVNGFNSHREWFGISCTKQYRLTIKSNRENVGRSRLGPSSKVLFQRFSYDRENFEDLPG